jgi:hypothetical protein
MIKNMLADKNRNVVACDEIHSSRWHGILNVALNSLRYLTIGQ